MQQTGADSRAPDRPRRGADGGSPRRDHSLADAIEAALDRGDLVEADRLAHAVLRDAGQADASPRLSEAIVLLRCLHGRYEEAARIVDRTSPKSSRLRHLRSLCLLALGRRTDAHLSLLGWTDRATAPAEARRLLALLEADGGADAESRRLLTANLRNHDDFDTILLLLCDAVRRGDPVETASWAERLRRLRVYPAFRGRIDVILASLGLARVEREAAPSTQQVARLAEELIAAEATLPTLLEAQRRSFDRPSARLLVGAIERALPRLKREAEAIAGLAELLHVLDGAASAAPWIERGLAAHPMSASLQRVASIVQGGDRQDSHRSDRQIEPHFEPGVIARIGVDRRDSDEHADAAEMEGRAA